MERKGLDSYGVWRIFQEKLQTTMKFRENKRSIGQEVCNTWKKVGTVMGFGGYERSFGHEVCNIQKVGLMELGEYERRMFGQ